MPLVIFSISDSREGETISAHVENRLRTKPSPTTAGKALVKTLVKHPNPPIFTMSNEGALRNPAILPERPAIPCISEPKSPQMKRVGRPLREIKYIPIKELVFYSKKFDPSFHYDKKIKTNHIGATQIVVQVKSVGLNPVDLTIINSYTTSFNPYTGIGREYSGIITYVGKNVSTEWEVGSEVCGVYFHPTGKGALSSSILIDPQVDPIVLKPDNLTWNEAGSWMFTFGSAWQMLESVKKNLRPGSTVFVNGGSSSVALMAIQLLKTDFKVGNIAATASHAASELVKSAGANLIINYRLAQNQNLPQALNILATTGVYKDVDDKGQTVEHRFVDQGTKFDLILDFVGSYELVANSSKYLKSKGQYITTVGSNPANYSTDRYMNQFGLKSSSFTRFGSAFGGNSWKFEFDPRPAEWIKIGADALEAGDIVNYIDKAYDWKNWKDAFGYLRKGHAHGKVVLEVEDF